MKLFLIILAFFVPSVLLGQYGDSVHKKSSRMTIPLTTGVQTYVPGGGNRFDMTYRFVAGARVQCTLSPHILVMGGGRFWGHVNGSYGINSRSWGQSGFHGAFGLLYVKSSKEHQFYAGLTLTRLSYFLGGMFPGETNEKFQRVTRAAVDTVPGIRGNYYTAPYVFLQWRVQRFQKSTTVELNVLIPGAFPSPINSWQPGGALVHALRTKVIREGSFRFVFDAQVPVIAKADRVGYSDFSFQNLTGKIEIAKPFRFTGGAVHIGLGYEREWHALNFPLLLASSHQRGSWGAWYVGIVAESVLRSRK